jgi:hypothetical protein
MRESDLRAIDDTVTDGLEDDEKWLVLRVEDEILEGGLDRKVFRQRLGRRVAQAVRSYLQGLVGGRHGRNAGRG